MDADNSMRNEFFWFFGNFREGCSLLFDADFGDYSESVEGRDGNPLSEAIRGQSAFLESRAGERRRPGTVLQKHSRPNASPRPSAESPNSALIV